MISADRENILGQIREALLVTAPAPQTHVAHESPEVAGPADWLPFVGPSSQERIDLFAKNAAELKAKFTLCDGAEEANRLLREAAILEDWKQIAAHRTSAIEQATAALGLPVLWTDGGYNAKELETCDVGITECDALIAQTGSVLVTNKTAGGRGLSVLPPHHVVLARREQLIADLPAAFELLASRYGDAYPSFISLITGPSRTGDIERILVLGAHGPKALTILVW